MPFAILYYNYKRGLRDPEIAEAVLRVENIFGKGKVRLEGFDYQPFACCADEYREGGPLSFSCPFGRFRGLVQIKEAFPLPQE